MASKRNSWEGHAPDLVRDNRLMHEEIAAQARRLEALEDENIKLKLVLAHACKALDSDRTGRTGYIAQIQQEIREALEWKHEDPH